MNIKEVFAKQLEKIKPSSEETDELNGKTRDFLKFLEERIKKLGMRAEVFLGGSFAKGTIIKKKKYDVDIFIRFETGIDRFDKIFTSYKDYKMLKVHGSRDYYQFSKGNMIFEIVPVKKIKKPEEAENVTDLSFFHVSYVAGKLKKNKKLVDEILLAKAFCHGQKCYGAESYVSGFSGYAIELLMIHYKSFEKMLRTLSQVKERAIIDIEKKYKSKKEVMMEINESKLLSPIVLVDPTFQRRNALAALSAGTFERFKQAAANFLKKPSMSFFEESKIDKGDYNLCIKIKTNKQEGDIAGSKMLKFHRFIKQAAERYFIVKKEGFEYDEGKEAISCLNVKARGSVVLPGPKVTDIENLVRFKKAHKHCFIKNHQAFAKENLRIKPEDFLREFKERYSKMIEEMGIVGIEKA